MIRRWWSKGMENNILKSSTGCWRFLDCSATCGTFDALLVQTIDATLRLRCTLFGYQYSEILHSLMCVYLCGGSCIEDVTTHLMKHLSLHPTLRTCSADTILRAIEELTCKNITYKSASGNSYDFNTADKMNCLLIKALLATGQLKSGQEYDFDFDHQFNVTGTGHWHHDL